MHDTALAGRRILVVEDDYLLAESLNDLLVEAGINVVGPVGSVPDALSLVASGQAIDGALLDVNVRGQAVFPVADALMERACRFPSAPATTAIRCRSALRICRTA